LYTAQKRNSHYAPQPYTNQSVFKSLLNCTIEISQWQQWFRALQPNSDVYLQIHTWYNPWLFTRKHEYRRADIDGVI